MLTVKKAKEKGIIREEYHALVPDYCTEESGGCGSELVVTNTLSELSCSNPRCNIKLASRGAAMLNAFGIKGSGYEFCKKFIDNNGFNSHLALFVATEKMLNNTGRLSDAHKLYKLINKVKAMSYTYPTLVGNLCLPGLDARARDIFKDCSSLRDFYLICDYLNVTPEQYIAGFPGFGSVLSKQIAGVIETFKVELIALPAIFNIVPECPHHYNIAVTGAITKLSLAVNRNDFKRYLNTIGKGYISFDIGKAFNSCDYFVADEPSSSTTYKAGMARQKMEDEIYEQNIKRYENGEIGVLPPRKKVIVTSAELESIILAEVERLKGGEDRCQNLDKLITSLT